MAVLVQNLPSQLAKTDFDNLFEKYGRVQSIDDTPETGSVIIELDSEENENLAISKLNGIDFLGQKLVVSKVKNKEASKKDSQEVNRSIRRPPNVLDQQGGP